MATFPRALGIQGDQVIQVPRGSVLVSAASNALIVRSLYSARHCSTSAKRAFGTLGATAAWLVAVACRCSPHFDREERSKSIQLRGAKHSFVRSGWSLRWYADLIGRARIHAQRGGSEGNMVGRDPRAGGAYQFCGMQRGLGGRLIALVLERDRQLADTPRLHLSFYLHGAQTHSRLVRRRALPRRSSMLHDQPLR